MSSQVTVRLGCQDDTAAFLRLAEAMHEESARRGLSLDGQLVENEVGYHVHRPHTNCCFVAECNDQVVGFIGGLLKRFEFSTAQRLCSTFVYVVPAFRGSFAFLKLLRAFEAWGEQHGAVLVQIGMSGGVNSNRLRILFGKLHYRHIGNTLVWRPGQRPRAPRGVTHIRQCDAADVPMLMPIFRMAHQRSPFVDIAFDEERFRHAMLIHLASRRTRIFDLTQEGKTVGVFAIFTDGYATNEGRVVKCIFAHGQEPRSSQPLLASVQGHLMDLFGEEAASELFWLTVGSRRPMAAMRAIQALSYVNLGGTFVKSLKPAGAPTYR